MSIYPDSERIVDFLEPFGLKENMTELIVAIIGLSGKPFDEEGYGRIVDRLRTCCDYSIMNTGIACLYGGLMYVMYDNPAIKVHQLSEYIERLRKLGFRSRITNLMALAILDNEDDVENRGARALHLYHLMHEHHSFITGEDDYLPAIYLAELQVTDDMITEKTEHYHRMLAGHYSRGNSLQTLCHQLMLLDMDQDSLMAEMDRYKKTLKQQGIHLRGYQYMILPIMICFGIEPEAFSLGLQQVIGSVEGLEDMRHLNYFQGGVLALEAIKSCLRPRVFTELGEAQQGFGRASLMIMLSVYMFKEKLF